MENILKIIEEIENGIDECGRVGYETNESEIESVKDDLKFLKEQLSIANVVKSFTAEDVVNELKENETLDDAISYFDSLK